MSEEITELEEKAMAQGWNPDYDGPNKKSAKEFIATGEEISAIQKERNDKLFRENQAMKKQLEGVTTSVQKLEKFYKEQSEKKVAAEIARLKSERATAISEGDGDKVNDLDDQIDQLKSQPQETEKKTNGPTPAFKTWVADNAWYEEDPLLAAEADMTARMLVESGRITDEEELFKQVSSRVKRLYPEKFENPNRNEPGNVEAGTRSGKSNKKTYNDLPPDAKAACDDFVANIPGFTVEQYLNTYQFED